MSTIASSHAPPHDFESTATYTGIPSGPGDNLRRRPKKLLAGAFVTVLFLLSVVFLFNNQESLQPNNGGSTDDMKPSYSSSPARGVGEGVSDKGYRRLAGGGGGKLSFAWTKKMLTWQRTAYHFQPDKNWINDPDGPLHYKGWYHLFYQYNPDSAVWGNITWAHAVSRDLIHWLHVPYAMVPDKWYDVNGVWTGSATLLPDGSIVMLYTGDTYDVVQVQCLAYPANLSDPLLLEWVKDPSNPVMTPPPGIGTKDFRDPTTAWLGPTGDRWRITIGSKVGKTGVSLVYETEDFVRYRLLDGFLHQVPGTGMWECIDFYPISLTEPNGLDTSFNGPGIKHVMKASLDDDKNDYYAIGTYDSLQNKWVPDDPKLDVGIGLRYDYGKYYAAKTFYDQSTGRRILWGWIRETDAEELDLLKGWSGVQSIPRTIVFDRETKSNLIQWPVEEVEGLRSSEKVEYEEVELEPGSVVPIRVDSSSQLDIMASFEIDESAFTRVSPSSIENESYDCTASGGAVKRGALGPFGIIVLADEPLSELTPIYFYVVGGNNGKQEVHFCADELRSSKAVDVDKIIYGSKVPVLDGEKLTIRSLVDHSIVESFAQGGRNVITSRVYPTTAVNDDGARILLFNNATEARVLASVKIWKMESADIRPFPFE